jgi:hypothetical protein
MELCLKNDQSNVNIKRGECDPFHARLRFYANKAHARDR